MGRGIAYVWDANDSDLEVGANATNQRLDLGDVLLLRRHFRLLKIEEISRFNQNLNEFDRLEFYVVINISKSCLKILSSFIHFSRFSIQISDFQSFVYVGNVFRKICVFSFAAQHTADFTADSDAAAMTSHVLT